MTPDALAFLGLTAIVGSLVGLLTFAVLRIFAAARSSALRERGADSSMLGAALQEAAPCVVAGHRLLLQRFQPLDNDAVIGAAGAEAIQAGRPDTARLRPTPALRPLSGPGRSSRAR